MDVILLATDLDGTLVGDDSATHKLNAIIKELRETIGLRFAYVTGRSPELFNELREEKSLLMPDALVTAVGSEIYIEDELLTEWPKVAAWDIEQIKQILAQHSALKLQPATEQRRFKLSYFIENDDHLVETIRDQLKDFPVSVVYSTSLYIDILPKGVNKGSALQFLANKWGVDESNIYACGDSGNDIDMLAISNAIIVCNAKDELSRWAMNQSDHIYKAEGTYANGIMEGLEHYRILS
jgi:sucrose-6F-phosphate phosphohydrolase